MKRYLLIVASLCLVACGGKDKSKYYLLLNDSSSVLQVNDEQVPRDQCFELRDGEHTSDFPLSLSKISAELVLRTPVEVKEPGHYIWNGSEVVKVADKNIEEHKKTCRDKKKKAAADPNIQASTIPASEAKSDIPLSAFEPSPATPTITPETTEQSTEGADTIIVTKPPSGESVQIEGDSKAPEPEADPKPKKDSITAEDVAVTSVPKTDDQAADPNVQASTDPASPDEKIEPRYFIYNESNEDVRFNAKTVAATHCTKSGFLSSDFPVKAGEMSLEEPGHYIWNGSAFVKAEEEYIRAACKETSDPTVQPVSSSERDAPETTEQPAEGADTPAIEVTSGETVQIEEVSQTPEPPAAPASSAPVATAVANYSYLQHLSPIMLEKCGSQYGIGSIHTFVSSDGNICQVSEYPLDKCANEKNAWVQKYRKRGYQCNSKNGVKMPKGDCKSQLITEAIVCVM